jgi:hypothetical protein
MIISIRENAIFIVMTVLNHSESRSRGPAFETEVDCQAQAHSDAQTDGGRVLIRMADLR